LSYAAFLLPFSDVLSSLPDALFDMFDVGRHIAIDLLEKIDELDEFLRCGNRQAGRGTRRR
jgi:hypothetical protein